jgi:hypothetical protein
MTCQMMSQSVLWSSLPTHVGTVLGHCVCVFLGSLARVYGPFKPCAKRTPQIIYQPTQFGARTCFLGFVNLSHHYGRYIKTLFFVENVIPVVSLPHCIGNQHMLLVVISNRVAQSVFPITQKRTCSAKLHSAVTLEKPSQRAHCRCYIIHLREFEDWTSQLKGDNKETFVASS